MHLQPFSYSNDAITTMQCCIFQTFLFSFDMQQNVGILYFNRMCIQANFVVMLLVTSSLSRVQTKAINVVRPTDH